MKKYTEFLYIVYIAHRQTIPLMVFVHLDKNRQILYEKLPRTSAFLPKSARIDIENRLYIWYPNCIKINSVD